MDLHDARVVDATTVITEWTLTMTFKAFPWRPVRRCLLGCIRNRFYAASARHSEARGGTPASSLLAVKKLSFPPPRCAPILRSSRPNQPPLRETTRASVIKRGRDSWRPPTGPQRLLFTGTSTYTLGPGGLVTRHVDTWPVPARPIPRSLPRSLQPLPSFPPFSLPPFPPSISLPFPPTNPRPSLLSCPLSAAPARDSPPPPCTAD